jgi:hypothetical protein
MGNQGLSMPNKKAHTNNESGAFENIENGGGGGAVKNENYPENGKM